MDEKGLGSRLQAARQAAGMTQQQLCAKADLSYSTLAKIERGAIKSPSIFTIDRIAAALGISLDTLIGSDHTDHADLPKKRSKSGVSFVYFDINGCLVRFFHRAFTRLAEETNKPADVIETAFWHFNDEVCRGEITMEEFNKEVSRRIDIPKIDWLTYYLEAVTPVAEMHDLVKWAADNYKIGLLSNIMPGFIDALIQKGLVPNLPYTAIIDSSVVHVIKPEAAMYQIAQEKAGVPANEILLIDDDRPNLMAAEKQGWHVLWFDDYEVDDSTGRVREALEPAEG